VERFSICDPLRQSLSATERIFPIPIESEQGGKEMKEKERKSRKVEKQALQIAENTDMSPNQAKALIRTYGDDKKEIEKQARNFKAES
jgi:hypothetical protein